MNETQANTVAIAEIAVQVGQTTKDLDKLAVMVGSILKRLPKAVSTAVLMWGVGLLMLALGSMSYFVLERYQTRLDSDHVQDMRIIKLELEVSKIKLEILEFKNEK